MKIPFKKGFAFIGTAVALYVTDKILGLAESNLTTVIPTLLNLSPLMIIEIIAFCILGVGVLLILNEHYGWSTKSKTQNTKHPESESKPKYDAKFLNDKIFRRLMRVRYHTNYKGDLIFEIPIDERAFQPRKSNIYFMWINDKIMNRDEANDYVSMDQAIPNVKIGEKYLQFKHDEVYKMWSEVKSILEKHN